MMKRALVVLAFLLLPSAALAQCNGIFGAAQVCGSLLGGPPGAVNLSILGIPNGGTTGQALVKLSNTDYITGWQTIGGGGSASAYRNDFCATGITGCTYSFSAGATSVTLSQTPAAQAAVWVSFDGVTQSGFAWQLSGNTITFSDPIKSDVKVIDVAWLTTNLVTGTVTSVGFSDGSSTPIFSITNSPVTSSGLLTETLIVQSPNIVFAGPSSGGAAQPSFRSLVGADLPNPSASTLGGIESAVSQSHKWINAISTLGVPALTQPGCGDLSDSAAGCTAVAMTATVGGLVPTPPNDATKFLNGAGAFTVPPGSAGVTINSTTVTGGVANYILYGDGTKLQNETLSTALDTAIGSTQGTIMYRGATVWAALTPGTNGYFLETQGSSANPTWAPASGGTGCVSGGSSGNVLTADGAGGCTTDTNTSLTNGALSLGSSGTLGSVIMGNATSGTITLEPVTGALGSITVYIPAASGATLATVANINTALPSATSSQIYVGTGGAGVAAVASTLPTAAVPAFTGDVTNSGGSLATTVGKIGGNTVTLGGALTTSGAYALTLTLTGATNVTLPTSGTLVNSGVTSLASLATVGTIGTGTWQGSLIGATYGGTGVNNGSKTITLGGALTTTGAATPTLAFGSGSWTYTFQASANDTVALLKLRGQTLAGGVEITSYSIGTLSSGTTTIDCGNSPQQYLTNGGAFTLAAPASDSNCLVLITNNGSAGAITFSGFTSEASHGDSLDTTNGHKFTVSVWEINGTADYRVVAMQ